MEKLKTLKQENNKAFYKITIRIYLIDFFYEKKTNKNFHNLFFLKYIL